MSPRFLSLGTTDTGAGSVFVLGGLPCALWGVYQHPWAPPPRFHQHIPTPSRDNQCLQTCHASPRRQKSCRWRLSPLPTREAPFPRWHVSKSGKGSFCTWIGRDGTGMRLVPADGISGGGAHDGPAQSPRRRADGVRAAEAGSSPQGPPLWSQSKPRLKSFLLQK